MFQMIQFVSFIGQAVHGLIYPETYPKNMPRVSFFQFSFVLRIGACNRRCAKDVDPNTDEVFCCRADAIFLLAVIATVLQQLLHLQVHETNTQVVIEATQERVVSATSILLITCGLFPSFLRDHKGNLDLLIFSIAEKTIFIA